MSTITVRNFFRAGWLGSAVLLLFLGTGCSGVVKNVKQSPDYDPGARDGAKYAVGCLVLGDKVELDRQAEIGTADQNADPGYQTDAWAPLLYGAMLAGREQLEVWSWGALRDNIPSDTITAIQKAYSWRDELPPEMFSSLAKDLPEITYLVLARVDNNELSIGGNSLAAAGNQDVVESRDPHAAVRRSADVTVTKRELTVTMDVIDLRTGLSVWRGVVKRYGSELFSMEEAAPGDLLVTPATEEGGSPDIQVSGTALDMPQFEDVLAVACGDLVKKLFTVADKAGDQYD